MEDSAVKLCECGCGNPVPMARWTDKRRGHIKGQPIKFVGHHAIYSWCGKYGEQNLSWKGGQRKNGRGYMTVWNSQYKKYVPLHRLMAEKAIGRPLPLEFPVHHHSEMQLVICESDAYHFLLHLRTKAYFACGHADWWKCVYCKKYDAIDNLIMRKHGKYIQYAHRECKNKYSRDHDYRKRASFVRENPLQVASYV